VYGACVRYMSVSGVCLFSVSLFLCVSPYAEESHGQRSLADYSP